MGVVRVFCRALLPSVFEKWHRQSKDEANMSRAGRIETWVILFIIIVIIVGIILI
jgi:t-SNARE complex subunit (syntaxin)